MKQKAPAFYLGSAAVATPMMCFCVPVIGHAQIINLPAPERRGEILLCTPPVIPALPEWVAWEARGERLHPDSERSEMVQVGVRDAEVVLAEPS